MHRRFLMFASVVVVVATACGGGDDGGEDVATLSDVVVDDTAAAGGEEEPIDTEQSLLDFTQCMRDNGIEMDDPEVDADGNLRLARPRNLGDGGADSQGDREAVQVAREECAELLEGATLGLREGFDRTEIEDTLVEYASCMRENGYEMADPDFSGTGPGAGPGGGPFGEIDPEDPAFVAADEACGEIRAGFGAGRGRAPGGAGGGG